MTQFTVKEAELYFSMTSDLRGVCCLCSRWAQFFICPLMIEDAVDREVEAVDSGESKRTDIQILQYIRALFQGLSVTFCFFCDITSCSLILRVPACEAIRLSSEGDAVWESGQTRTPNEQVLLG